MKTTSRGVLGLAMAAGLAVPLAVAGQGTMLLVDTRPVVAKPAVEAASQRLGINLDAAGVPVVALGPVDVLSLRREDALMAQTGAKQLRYGVKRDVSVTLANGAWIGTPDGGLMWSVDVLAVGAFGVRLGFSDIDLPGGAELTAYAVERPERLAGPYQGRGLWDNGSTYTQTLFGSRIRVELYLPPGVEANSKFFALRELQHVYRDPAGDVQTDEGACHNDVTCFPAWANVARAAAGIGTLNGNALFCSGQLVNTVAGDQSPYYLTANHCLSSASSAQNSEIYFFYQTSVCNGPVPSLASVPQSLGCSLVSTGSASDYTLLMVEGALPNGVAWAGWTGDVPALNTELVGIHHPDGAYKRISFARMGASPPCGGTSTNHLQTLWYAPPGLPLAITEPGSSGSGIFRADTQQLVGQLHCGPSACTSSNQQDAYGAFSFSFPLVQAALQAGSDDSFEPDDSLASAAALTAAQNYPGLIVKSTSPDFYRMTVQPGTTLQVQANFVHANGDVDLQLLNTSGAVLGSSATTANQESISYTNSSGGPVDVVARVFLASDTRNTYSFRVIGGGIPGPATGACCVPFSACQVLTAVECSTAGGTYAGDSTVCGSVCPPIVDYVYSGSPVPIVDSTRGVLDAGDGDDLADGFVRGERAGGGRVHPAHVPGRPDVDVEECGDRRGFDAGGAAGRGCGQLRRGRDKHDGVHGQRGGGVHLQHRERDGDMASGFAAQRVQRFERCRAVAA